MLLSCTCSRPQLSEWLNQIALSHHVSTPVKTGEKSFRFQPVTESALFHFEEYVPTVMPPVRTLFPMDADVFSYKKTTSRYSHFENIDESPQIIFGVRPCDLRAIHITDKVLLHGAQDPGYSAKRNATVIVAYRCSKPCSPLCFCGFTGAINETRGADVLLTPDGDTIHIEVYTPAGKELYEVSDFSKNEHDKKKSLKPAKNIPDTFGRTPAMSLHKTVVAVNSKKNSRLLTVAAERCVSCGICNYVCPTCTCFCLHDSPESSETAGSRTRSLAACMTERFGTTPGEAPERKTAAERTIFRYTQKWSFQTDNPDVLRCTGCGRCVQQCPAGIDIYSAVTRAGENI